jgi:hypothetical protein
VIVGKYSCQRQAQKGATKKVPGNTGAEHPLPFREWFPTFLLGRSYTVRLQAPAYSSTANQGQAQNTERTGRFGQCLKIAARQKASAASAMTRGWRSDDMKQASVTGGKRQPGRSIAFVKSGSQERGGARHCGGRPKPSIGSAHSATSSDRKKYSHVSTSTIVTRVRGAAIA